MITEIDFKVKGEERKKLAYAIGELLGMSVKYTRTPKFDYLIGMDDANVRNIQRICGGDPEHKITKLLDHAGANRSIADPWYTGDFEATYRDVVEGCNGFLAYLRREGKI